MPFEEKSSDGVTNSATPVVMVAAPGAATRRLVRHVTFHNPMAVESVVLTFYLDNNGQSRIIFEGTLSGGDTFDSDDDLYILDTTLKTLNVKLGGAPTLQIQWTAAYGDAT